MIFQCTSASDLVRRTSIITEFSLEVVLKNSYRFPRSRSPFKNCSLLWPKQNTPTFRTLIKQTNKKQSKAIPVIVVSMHMFKTCYTFSTISEQQAIMEEEKFSSDFVRGKSETICYGPSETADCNDLLSTPQFLLQISFPKQGLCTQEQRLLLPRFV